MNYKDALQWAAGGAGHGPVDFSTVHGRQIFPPRLFLLISNAYDQSSSEVHQ